MALKVEIKPGERVIIGGSIITNDGNRARLYVDGHSPILREKDVMRPDDADTPCKKIYLTIQTMYLSETPDRYFKLYFDLLQDVQKAAPSMMVQIDRINNKILTGSYYKALKLANILISREKELMENARGS